MVVSDLVVSISVPFTEYKTRKVAFSQFLFLIHIGKRLSHPRPNGDPTAIYTHNNITYITNERTGEEVTSYANPIPLDPVPITPEMQKEHNKAVSEIQQDKTKWKSNTVI